MQRKLDEIIQDLKGEDIKALRRRFKYKSKEVIETIDWKAYNVAQLEEINNQLILIENMVNKATKNIWELINPKGREGQPAKSASDRAKAILVQQYFMASDRLTAGLMLLFDKKLEISERLTDKDIERAYDSSDVAAILMEVFRMTNEPLRNKETEFSIDGSGMPRTIKTNYANDSRDENKRAGYDMLVGMIGINTKVFTAVDVKGPGCEAPYLPPLLEETQALYSRIDLVTADAGYLSRDNCAAIADAEAEPFIFPKEGITVSKKGSDAWKSMLMKLIEDPQKWSGKYHKRSISECGFSIWKRKYTRPLGRKIRNRRKMEIFARVVDYNIRRLGYLHYLKGLEVPWLGM